MYGAFLVPSFRVSRGSWSFGQHFLQPWRLNSRFGYKNEKKEKNESDYVIYIPNGSEVIKYRESMEGDDKPAARPPARRGEVPLG